MNAAAQTSGRPPDVEGPGPPAVPQRPAIVVSSIISIQPDRPSLVACKPPRPALAYRQRRHATEDHVEKKNIEGGLDQAKGKIKEVGGVATGDRELEGEGKLDNLKGKIKDKAGNLRESVEDKLDDLDRDRGNR
jgi:uncharacterized protein YjbJ (UPF0337 family)